MGIGTSIFLIAVGAILKFAVHTSVSGVSIQTIGVILLVIGILWLLIELVQSRAVPVRRRATVVRDEPVVVVPAAAGEADAVDGRMSRPGQPLELAEGRQADVRLASRGAGKGVAGGQRVVHGDPSNRSAGRRLNPLCGMCS